jgi:dissimilatory sulfite reductase (desulfoviridin) alpha/beta subunit
MERLDAMLKKKELLGFLKERVGDNLKFHHEFRVTLAECPNACSQPQIKDIGILGACLPKSTEAACSACGACEKVCKENAVFVGPERSGPRINTRRCLACGSCIPACPTGTLAEGRRGYRVQVGGKLGRHPLLSQELPGIYDEDETLEIVDACVDFYKTRSRRGERFGEILQRTGLQTLIDNVESSGINVRR